MGASLNNGVGGGPGVGVGHIGGGGGGGFTLGGISTTVAATGGKGGDAG
jgi:hypothetical protein